MDSVLPIQSMGVIIRGTVASGAFRMTSGGWALLAAWCIGGLGLAYLTLSRPS